MRQRLGDWKNMQQVRMIKDRDRNILTGGKSILGGWKEYFEELINEEN